MKPEYKVFGVGILLVVIGLSGMLLQGAVL